MIISMFQVRFFKFFYRAIVLFSLFATSPAFAAVYVSGLLLSVDASDNVVVTSSGGSQFVNASVGSAGLSALAGGLGN